jgi:hypothetical protein
MLESSAVFVRQPSALQKEILMKNPLDSLWGTIVSGLVLTLILYLIVRAFIGG